MNTRVWLMAMALAVCASQASAPGNTSDAEATKKLGVFVGKWKSEGSFFETAYSKAHKVTSDVDCGWSPHGDFLICEQLISEPLGQHIQLSIFSYNSKDGTYSISSMAGPGKPPWSGTVLIEGTLWTYPGNKADKVWFRTTNDFSTPGTEVFKTEFSADGGEHWTTTLQGTAKKVSG
jgi:hypothetical protein